jgi:hypothetical protein
MKLDGYEVTAFSALALSQVALVLGFTAPTSEIAYVPDLFALASAIVAGGATAIGRAKDLEVGPFQPRPLPPRPPRRTRKIKGGYLIDAKP